MLAAHQCILTSNLTIKRISKISFGWLNEIFRFYWLIASGYHLHILLCLWLCFGRIFRISNIKFNCDFVSVNFQLASILTIFLSFCVAFLLLYLTLSVYSWDCFVFSWDLFAIIYSFVSLMLANSFSSSFNEWCSFTVLLNDSTAVHCALAKCCFSFNVNAIGCQVWVEHRIL